MAKRLAKLERALAKEAAQKRKKEQKLKEQLVAFNAETDTLAVALEAYKQGFISNEGLKVFTDPKVSIVERRRTLLKRVLTSSEEKILKFANHYSEALVEQALRERLINRDVFDHLTSLHSEVPYSMRLRYLLQSARLFLTGQLETFKARALTIVPYQHSKEADPLEFAKDAARDGLIDNCVVDYLISLYPEDSFYGISHQDILEHSEGNNKLLKSLGDEASSLANLSSIVSRVTEQLTPEDLPKLNELLGSYAFKWKCIGCALNFQPQDLQTIEASPLLVPDAPKSYLAKLLEDWLLRKLKHTSIPSVDRLKKALSSRTVGLGSLADQVDKICRHTFQSELNMPYRLINVGSFSPMHDTVYVKEGLSTLFEIQVKHPSKKKYQWLENGKELYHDSSTEPILCLYQASIDMDGYKYFCRVQPVVSTAATPTFTLKVSCVLDQFRSNLVSVYLAQSEVPEDTWPPVANLKYINLALVRQQRVDYNSESARLTIRGDVDDVLQDKKIIAYNEKEFYCNLSSGKLMLIEGRPGSGKTTFVHKLTQDWAVKSEGEIRLLLLVSLRVLNIFSHPDLSDILKLLNVSQVSKDIIEQRSGKGVCFIFDGFDEFSPQNGQSSIVYKIINKTYLPHSMVIVASRPAAIAKLRHKASIVIEVVGFLNKQILEYFDRYPFSTPTQIAELKRYLEFHPNILHLCYLPIHATMVAFLFQEMGEVPKTETDIYTHFTRFTLIRNLTKTRELEPVGIDLPSLTGEEGLCFKKICLLAFEKTILNKQVLDQSEVSSQFQVKRSIDSSLGLITVDRTAGLYGYKNIYTFMHLTFQEYLAAYHISTLSKEEQLKLIQDYGDKNHMLVVWKFFCGLIEIKPPYYNRFKSILHKTEGSTLFHIQCGYESQQKIVCAQLLKSVNYHFMFEDKYLSTPDFTAIGYVTNTTLIPTKLSFLKCDMNTVAIDALLSEMEDRARDSIHALHLAAALFDDSQVECTRKLLDNLKSLKSLSLEAGSEQHTHSNKVSSIKLSGLKELSLIYVDIRPLLNKSSFLSLSSLRLKGDLKTVCNCISHCRHFKELDLSGYFMSETNAQDLAKSLNDCDSLERINLDKTSLSSSGVAAIFKSLRHCYLKVKASELPGSMPVSELLKYLEKMTNLQSLEISMHIGHFAVLSEYAREWKKFKELNVSLLRYSSDSCSFPLNFLGFSVELESLTVKNYAPRDALPVCPDQFQKLEKLILYKSMISSLEKPPLNLPYLQELHIDSALIGDAKIERLITNIQNSSNLEILSLPRNHISGHGGMMLAATFHLFANLKKVNLEDNDIDSTGSHLLVSCLKSCSHFQELNLLRNPCHFSSMNVEVTFSVLLSQ